MKSRSLDSDILRIAAPSILANLTVPLVGLVDISVAGHLGGGDAVSLIAGISLGTMLFDLLYWNFSFLRIGTGGLASQAYGASDMGECARILLRGLFLSLAVSVMVLLIQWPFQKLVFLFVKSSSQARSLALEYFFIRIWAAPATLCLYSLKGWFIGMQDGVSSMITDLVVNVLNMGLSVALAFGYLFLPALGYAGIAYGTVIAQYSGLATALLIVLLKYRRVFDGVSLKGVLSKERIGPFMKMNGDYFLRSVGMIAIYVGFTAISSSFGDMLLSCSTIMMKLLMFFSYFTDGFAYSAQALCGKAIGEGDPERLGKVVGRVFLWSGGVALAFIAVYYFGGKPLLGLMTNDPSVVDRCSSFLVWLLLMPVAGVAAFTWDGVYSGATASREMRNSQLVSVAAFFAIWIPVAMIWREPLSLGSADASDAALHILLGAYFVHLLSRGAYQGTLYRKSVLSKCSSKAGTAGR